MILVFGGPVFGEESPEREAVNNYRATAAFEKAPVTEDTQENSVNENSGIDDSEGEESTESSFVVKLGTFLLIASVLMFLLQRRRSH